MRDAERPAGLCDDAPASPSAAEVDAQSRARAGAPGSHPEFDALVRTIWRLRQPDGCPWDRRQTHASIAGNMIEEAYEAVDAIEADDATHLREELGRRLAPAGVAIDDARLTHLAYAPEIAQAMLRRQQAEAVIAARRKIVEGAVSMVNMAVEELAQSGTIDLDDERKAAMASNLMVVLCGENDAQPVLNAGTLYQ